MLFTKSIYKPKYEDDGIRISVMSRHTLNDGVTIDTLITSESFDRHDVLLAPPPKLVGAYYKRGISFEEYAKKYVEYLSQPNISMLVKDFADNAMVSDLTLLCVEDDATYCHRRILAEECQKYRPALQVIHR